MFVYDVYRFYIRCVSVVFFNDTATTEIYTYGPTLSLHDALPICWSASVADRLATEVPKRRRDSTSSSGSAGMLAKVISGRRPVPVTRMVADRKSTRLNSSH